MLRFALWLLPSAYAIRWFAKGSGGCSSVDRGSIADETVGSAKVVTGGSVDLASNGIVIVAVVLGPGFVLVVGGLLTNKKMMAEIKTRPAKPTPNAIASQLAAFDGGAGGLL